MSGAKTIFFVCGMERSGTTWLKLLLDSHPEIVCKGEAHFFDRLGRRLHKTLKAYDAGLRKHGGPNNDVDFRLVDIERVIRTAIMAPLDRWAEEEGVRCVGEKTPANLRCLPRIRHFFPEARLIHIIRDGRDGAVSGWHSCLSSNRAEALHIYGDSSGYFANYAQVWSRTITKARVSGRDLGGLYHELRYEDLLMRPEETFGRLCMFLGVDATLTTLSACLEACAFERLSGGRVPGQEDPTSFYRKGQMGDWINHFSEVDRQRFEVAAGDLLQELGYAEATAPTANMASDR